MPLLETINRIPPFLVYSLARDHRSRPSLNELVKRSGLSMRTFTRIARLMTWNGVRADNIDAFCQACGVDILHPRKDRDYLRLTVQTGEPFCHLKPHQRKMLIHQLARWKEAKANLASA